MNCQLMIKNGQRTYLENTNHQLLQQELHCKRMRTPYTVPSMEVNKSNELEAEKQGGFPHEINNKNIHLNYKIFKCIIYYL